MFVMFEVKKFKQYEATDRGLAPHGSPEGDLYVVEKPRIAYVGYLAVDEDCENPLESCDGMGKIVHHPRSRYGCTSEPEWETATVYEPDSVPLDLYDHSLQSWSVSGSGPQCRWDTSHGESVWVPDAYARDEIDRRAQVYAFGTVSKTHSGKYAAQFGDDKLDVAVFDSWSEAFAWLEQRVATTEFSHDEPVLGRRRAAAELAAEACAQYTAWHNGDTWGYVIERFVRSENGAWVSDAEAKGHESCWGFVGSEYAEQELQSMLKQLANVEEDLPEWQWPEADLRATFQEDGHLDARRSTWRIAVGLGKTERGYLDWVRAKLEDQSHEEPE